MSDSQTPADGPVYRKMEKKEVERTMAKFFMD